MSVFLFLLLIPVSFASGDHCSSLARLLQNAEKDLHRWQTAECTSIKPADLIQGQADVLDPSFLEGKVCSEFGTLETQIEKLKGELSVLDGIEKLKVAIKKSKDEAGKGSQVSGLSFVSSLNTAQTLEVLVNTKDKDGKSFIQKLHALPDNKRITVTDLKLRVAEFCKELEDKSGACDPKIFLPRPDTTKEIYELIKSAAPTDEQVELWKKGLKIRRTKTPEEDSGYSFTQMQSELSGAFDVLDKNLTLNKSQLRAIKQLDNFESAPGITYVETIKNIKSQKEAKILSDKLLFIMGDARSRQQYEVQSKLSVAWDNNQHLLQAHLKAEESAECDLARRDYNKARTCHAHLKKAAANISDARVKQELLPAIGASIDYADALLNSENACKVELLKNGVIPESCLKDLSQDKAKIQDQIRQLNLLKDRIGTENQEKFHIRNYALKKWADYKCSSVPSSIEMCDLPEDKTTLSKNALLAVSDSMKVAIVFTPEPESEAQMTKICDEIEDDKMRKEPYSTLCPLLNPTPVVIETKNESTHPSASTDAPDGGHREAVNRDRYIHAGTGLMKDVLKHLIPRINPPFGVNPYPYNYAPYNNGIPPMGIADSIMFNARFHGAYGYYMPTPGLQPYTAFGVNSGMSAYRPLSVTTTRYFGR